MIRNCKSQSHVEFIISMILFIGVLFFIFVFINPFSNSDEDASNINKVEDAFIERISLNVSKLSVVLSPTGTCYNFPSSYGNKYAEVQESLRKYNVYFSENIIVNAPHKDVACNPKDYTLGVFSNDKMIFYEEIQAVANDYRNDYEGLKASLGIYFDFSFNVKDFAGNEIPELSVSGYIPEGVNVESKEIPASIINNNAQINNYIINIKVWEA